MRLITVSFCWLIGFTPSSSGQCTGSPRSCSSQGVSTSCRRVLGCMWWSSSDRCSGSASSCSSMSNSMSCSNQGCSWQSGGDGSAENAAPPTPPPSPPTPPPTPAAPCSGVPFFCSDLPDEHQCTTIDGCIWDEGSTSCGGTSVPCSSKTNAYQCNRIGCYWLAKNDYRHWDGDEAICSDTAATRCKGICVGEKFSKCRTLDTSDACVSNKYCHWEDTTCESNGVGDCPGYKFALSRDACESQGCIWNYDDRVPANPAQTLATASSSRVHRSVWNLWIMLATFSVSAWIYRL